MLLQDWSFNSWLYWKSISITSIITITLYGWGVLSFAEIVCLHYWRIQINLLGLLVLCLHRLLLHNLLACFRTLIQICRDKGRLQAVSRDAWRLLLNTRLYIADIILLSYLLGIVVRIIFISGMCLMGIRNEFVFRLVRFLLNGNDLFSESIMPLLVDWFLQNVFLYCGERVLIWDVNPCMPLCLARFH